LRTPITFDTNGFTLQPSSTRLLGQIADEIKACPGTKITVVGYTDDRGADAVNVPLSASRAKSVADALVSDGVAGVTSRGAGAAKPVDGNDTPAGRAQNRIVG
jgi:peptidoglycan-binding protein ArfA